MKIPSIVKTLSASYVVLGFAGFCLLDCGLRVIGEGPLSFSPFKTPSRTPIYYNVRDFDKKQARPQIALLGSSLMMTALHGGDAAYTNLSVNPNIHHSSQYFEKTLTETFPPGKQAFKTFAFCIGGEMVSDAFILTDALLTGQNQHLSQNIAAPFKPKVIIYGIAPRDFMDHALPSPAATTVFKFVKRMHDLSYLDDQAYATLNEKIEHLFEKISFIYAHRPDLVYRQQALAGALIQAIRHDPAIEAQTVHCPLHIRKQAYLELPEDTGINEGIIEPPEATEPFVDNTAEYKYRYKKYNQKQLDSQFGFLDRLLALGQRQNIRVILINMPLTQDNISLMAPGFYDTYLKRVKTVARSRNAIMLDLNDQSKFPKNWFGDSARLNSRGGMHFFKVLTEALASNEITRKIIADSIEAPDLGKIQLDDKPQSR